MIVMKGFTRIMLVGIVMLAMAICEPQRAEAQFFKKLSQGLEKVNNTLEKVNDGVGCHGG